MSYGVAGWSQDLATKPSWTSEGWPAQFCGSNIVVVYEPGDIDDLCLLWSLRAAHGFPRGFPLGVPKTADVLSELQRWTDVDDPNLHFAAKLRGFGRPFALTSCSISLAELRAYADDASGPWQVFAPDELLQSPSRPSIRSDDFAHFVNGEGRVAGWDQETRELLRARPPGAYGLNLHARISLQDRPLPPLRPLRLGDRALAPAWRDGGYDTQLPREPGGTIRIEWPSGIAVLRAAAANYGLEIRPSRPGRAAEAFVRRIGDFEQLDALKDEWVLQEVDRLTERQGTRWFRERMRTITASLAEVNPTDQLDVIHRQLDDMHVTAAGLTDAHDITASTLQRRLGRDGARAWLEWAEDRGLLIRGAQIDCDRRNARTWRAAGELSPPIICPGCGERIVRPFRADHLPFRYRPSQALVEVMANDALPHLVCASWWSALIGKGLYGMHPGIEFLDNGRVIGEADVVLLLPDGRLALGEVKRRAAGLKQRDIDLLENLAERTDALWTFYATPQYASECPEIWRDLRRELPSRRAFSLTGEQLLQPTHSVFHALGADPTEWEPISEEDKTVREDQFRERIVDMLRHLQAPYRMEQHLGFDG